MFKYSISSSLPTASLSLSKEITSVISQKELLQKEPIILCIGTDRSTGDSLGPLVGYHLSKYSLLQNIKIYGTLNDPVHAKNLTSFIEKIKEEHSNHTIIAIDSSLGKAENIGNINLCDGPLKPGAGVNKELPSVGDINITGVVNISGFMEYLILQNTRLSIVMQLAEVISRSIFLSFNSINKSEKLYS